jgi:tRNA(adenine34) deaminase
VLAAESQALLQAFFQERRSLAREQAEPLQDDALRTPDEAFDGLPGYPFPPRYVSDLASQHGWRLHYLDEGPRDVRGACLCLHGPGEWSYVFRHLAAVPGLRVLAPDLVGFGRSDKPKRASAHRLEWHRDLLLEWLDRLAPGPLVLIHTPAAAPLAALLNAAAPERFRATLAAPEGGEPTAAAWRAPFPDRGHEAALRAFGPARRPGSGPDAGQAARLAEQAMGYLAA